MNIWNKERLWYLSGGMTKFGVEEFHESNNWRKEIKDLIEDITDHRIICFNPNEHWSMKSDPNEFSDNEAMRLDIYKLRRSELVIYNNNDPFSRGSMIELGIAWELGLPIITLNDSQQELHPWVEQMSEKIFTSKTDMIMYLKEHYMCID